MRLANLREEQEQYAQIDTENHAAVMQPGGLRARRQMGTRGSSQNAPPGAQQNRRGLGPTAQFQTRNKSQTQR